MKTKLIAVVLALLAMSVPIFGRCAAPPMAELLPANSLGYVEFSDMEVLYYVVSEIGGAAVKSLEEEEDVPAEIKVKARAIVEAFQEIRPLLPKSASLGVISVDPQKHEPSLVLTTELSPGLTPIASAFGKLLLAAPEIKVSKTEHGVEVEIPHGPPPIGYAVRDNVVYLTMGQGVLDRILSGAAAERLSQAPQFKEISAAVGKNAFLTAYVNLDAIQELVLPFLPEKPKQFVELLGLKELHALGISLSATDQVVGFNGVLHFTENAPGIASLLSAPNTAPKGIAYIPQDFSYVGRCSLGPPAELLKKVQAIMAKAGVGENMEQVFAQVKEGLGIDVNKLLESLGGELTLGVKIPETLEIPTIIACVEAKDAAFVMETLKALATKFGAPVAETDLEGKKVLTITPTIPIPVTPALVADGDVIVIAPSIIALQNALAAKASGQNIASKPLFKGAMEGLPANANVALQYLETQSLGRLAVAALGMATMGAPEDVKPLVGRAMEYANKAIENLEPAVEVVYRTPNGLAIQGRWGTRSLMQIVTNGAAVAAKAAMYIIARPRFGPATVAPQEVEKPAAPEAEVVQPAAVTEEGKVFINLDPYVTRSMKNPHGSSPEGNDLPLEPGKQQFGDCIYLIAKGIIQLSGTNLPDAPAEVKGMKVGLKFKKLYFLHATGWGSDVSDGTEIGGYVIRYEDGSTVEIPIKYGVHVRDWWASTGSAVSEGKLAWTGQNQQSRIRLYSMAWENPNPDKAVTAVDYRSAGTACAPFAVAMTAEVE